MNSQIEKLMNEQIVHELYSSYLYLAMSAYFESVGLKGAAHWMRCQAQEEEVHAMKFYSHIIERGGRVLLNGIQKPPDEWKSALNVFEEAYAHEKKVTDLINNLMSTADQEKDYASKSLLQWFVDEQIEEESSTLEIAEQLKVLGDNGPGLLMLDRELAQRVFTYPQTLANPAA